MNQFLFLFELEFPSVNYMYSLFLAVGGIGFLLALLRRWASLIWLLFSTLPLGIIFIAVWTIEIYSDLYEAVIRMFGASYILHVYISVIAGILLNLLGIFIKSIYSKKLTLR